MPPVGFEPTISAGERPQTYALDRVATGTSIRLFSNRLILASPFHPPNQIYAPCLKYVNKITRFNVACNGSYTQRRTTDNRTPLDEWSARCRNLYRTTQQYSTDRQTSMLPVGFEPTISAGERPQTYPFNRAATVTGYPGSVSNKSENSLKPVSLPGKGPCFFTNPLVWKLFSIKKIQKVSI